MNDSYDTYIETVTDFIGEYCDRERIQRDDFEDFPLTDDNWNRLDDLFFDKMKEVIEEDKDYWNQRYKYTKDNQYINPDGSIDF